MPSDDHSAAETSRDHSPDQPANQSASQPLTWATLLAHWTAIAQTSAKLPPGAEGDRWRAAAAPIISLQAVTFALGDLDRVDRAPGERAAGLDKAELLIRADASTLHSLWRSEPMPEELVALVQDAKTALTLASQAGVEWIVTVDRLVPDHPGDLVDELVARGFSGDLFLPVPGTVLFRNSPAGFCRGPGGSRPEEHVLRAVKEFLVDVSRPERRAGLRQVYRQFDFSKGGPVRDLVKSVAGEPVAGQAQLIPAILAGVPQAVYLPIPGMSSVSPLPVVFED